MSKLCVKDSNIELVNVDINCFDKMMYTDLDLLHHEIGVDLPKFLVDCQTDVKYDGLVDQLTSPDVKTKMQMLKKHQNVVENEMLYKEALKERLHMKDVYADLFEEHNLDALIYPTTPVEAKPIELCVQSVKVDGKIVPTFDIYTQNTKLGAFAGLPSISLPLTKTSKCLPVGISLESGKGTDRLLFKVAEAVRDVVLN